MNNKRILFLMINLPVGGAEWVVTNLCNEFTKKGIKVTLISVKGGSLVNELDGGVRVISFGGKYLNAFWFVYKELLFRKHDAVFSTQRFCAAILSSLHFLSFSNTILNIREAASNFGHSLKKHYWLRKSLFIFAYRRADNIIVNSEGTLNSLYENGIINKKQKITIIPNPLDISGIQNKSNERLQDPFDFDRYTIISIGRLVKKKNMDVLINSFKLIQKEIPYSQLLIIGDGPEKAYLTNLINNLDLKGAVYLAGFKNNPYPYLRSAKVFALVSEWEGFGMVVVESLALGVPVVATDIDSGPKTILKDGKYGELVKPGDIKGLANAIISLHNFDKYNSNFLVERAMEFDKSIISDRYLRTVLNLNSEEENL